MNEYEKLNQEPKAVEIGKYKIFFSTAIFEEYLDHRLNISLIKEIGDDLIIRFEFIPEDFDIDEGASMLLDAIYHKGTKFVSIKFIEEGSENYFYEAFSNGDFNHISIIKSPTGVGL